MAKKVLAWKDYPEFLERFEEETGISREEIMEMPFEELIQRVAMWHRYGYGEKPAKALLWEAKAQSEEGIAGKRHMYNAKLERWYWRDVATGRFTTPPTEEEIME